MGVSVGWQGLSAALGLFFGPGVVLWLVVTTEQLHCPNLGRHSVFCALHIAYLNVWRFEELCACFIEAESLAGQTGCEARFHPGLTTLDRCFPAFSHTASYLSL